MPDEQEPVFHLFADPASRFIFRFHDGEKNRAFDPFDVEDKIDQALEDESPATRYTKLDRLQAEYFEGRSERIKRDALAKLAEIARKAFGIKPFDEATETGLTVHEAFAVLSYFLECQAMVKKNIDEMRSLHQSTESSPT